MAVIVVAASTAASQFSVINFSENAPTSAMVNGYGGGNVVDCHGVLAAVGDFTGSSFTLFNLLVPSSPIWVSAWDTGLSKISAIAIGDKYVLACGMAPNQSGGGPIGTAVLVDIGNPIVPSTVSTFQASWLGTPTSCALSGTTAVVGGWMPSEVGPLGETPSVIATFDYTNPTTPVVDQFDTVGTNPLLAPLLSGPVLVDYDGTNVVACNAEPTGGNGAGTYIYSFSSGEQIDASLVVSGSPAAIAEIPDGGYYVAIGQAYSDSGVGGFYTIQAFPTNAQSGIYNSKPLEPAQASEATVVRFLNNPAVAPFLAVANATSSGRMFVRLNFLVLLQGGPEPGPPGEPSTIEIASPVPVAQVMLPGTGITIELGAPPAGITLGITALTPLSWHWPLPHFPPFPWRW